MKISSRTILKILTLTAAFIGVLWLAYLARQELTWMGIAFFLAVALNPTVELFRRIMPGRHRGLAIGSVFIVMLLLFGVLLALFVPPLVQQSEALAHNLPKYTDQLTHGQGWISDQIRTYHLADHFQQSQDQIVGYFTSAGSQFVGIVQSIFSSVIATITILGLTFFMLLEGEAWIHAAWQMVPPKRRTHAQGLVGRMYKAVTGYVNGNLLTSLIAAIVTAIALAVFGVPYAIPLGIFVGIMDLLPLVGATIGALVVLTVAIFTSVPAFIGMGVFFALYQQIENHALQPLVYGKTVEISPLLVLVAVLIGAAVGGILGAIVAIPIFASLQIVAKDYAQRHLAKG